MWRSRCVGSLRSNSAAPWNSHESLTVDTVADAKAPKEQPIRKRSICMATLEISADNFEDTITDNDIVLVDFWAEWCGPCKRFGPIYEKASEEYDGIVFAKLDTDAYPELTGMLGIEGIPTLMAFREGVLVFNQAGALPGHALKQVVDAVKGLDMDEVHAEVAKLRAEHSHES
jgi:thioredoxin 1